MGADMRVKEWTSRALGVVILSTFVGCAGGWIEGGAEMRPIRLPMRVQLLITDPANVHDLALGAGRGARVIAHARRIGDTCYVTMPPPTGPDDKAWGRTMIHELRHCNGERHDARGWWLS